MRKFRSDISPIAKVRAQWRRGGGETYFTENSVSLTHQKQGEGRATRGSTPRKPRGRRNRPTQPRITSFSARAPHRAARMRRLLVRGGRRRERGWDAISCEHRHGNIRGNEYARGCLLGPLTGRWNRSASTMQPVSPIRIMAERVHHRHTFAGLARARGAIVHILAAPIGLGDVRPAAVTAPAPAPPEY